MSQHFDPAWTQVKCDRCGREYQCTPWDDYYETPQGDHCCEPCLIGNRQVLYLLEQEDGSVAGPFGPLTPAGAKALLDAPAVAYDEDDPNAPKDGAR